MNKLGLGLLITLFFLPRFARADEPAPPEPAPVLTPDGANLPLEAAPPPETKVEKREREETAEVRVIGGKADALQKTPGSAFLITTKDLKRAAPVDAAEMLRRVPGVQVRQEYSGGGRLDISIRGLEGGRSRRVMLLEDGIPIALNPYAEPDMYYAPAIERYRAIEVVKGSGNILFGPQTLAGTINFVTLAPPDHRTVVADVDVGNYGYTRGLASYGDAVGDTRYVVQLLHRRGDGFRDQPFHATDGLAKIAFPTWKDGEAVVKLGFRKEEADSDDIGITRAMYERDPRRPTISPSSHLALERYDASLVHEQRFSANTKLKTLIYGYTTARTWRRQDYTRSPSRLDAYERIVGDVDVPGGAIYFKNSNVVLDREYGVLGLEPRFEHRASTFGVAHTLDFGGRVLRETAHYENRDGSYAQTNVGDLGYVEDHAGTALAGYVQDRIAFRDDLVVTPGVRYERLDFRKLVLRKNDGGTVRDVYEESNRTVNGFIPGVGMVYGKKTANVYGSVHYGYSPPRITSAISANGVSSEVAGDRSINYELGSRLAAKWARAEATGFLSNFNNQVIVATSGVSDANLTDAGATNLYGVETAGVLALDKLLDLPTIVELGARYTYAHSTFRYGSTSGKFLPYSPEHSFNTNFDVEHRSGVGGQIAYAFVSSQFADAANTKAVDISGRLGELEERHIVDATVHYRHKASGITLRLTAKNLLDTTYVIARRPEGIFPGPYRQLLLGLRWDWEPKGTK